MLCNFRKRLLFGRFPLFTFLSFLQWQRVGEDENGALVDCQPALYLHIQSVPRSNHSSVIKTSQSVLYREIIAVCSEIHTKHTNTLCGQNREFLNCEPSVWEIPSGFWSDDTRTHINIVTLYWWPTVLAPECFYGDRQVLSL